VTLIKRNTSRIKAMNVKFLRSTAGKTQRDSWNYWIFGLCPSSKNPVIPSVIYHHQNPLESTRRDRNRNDIFQEVRIQNLFRVKREMISMVRPYKENG
jgi:hypothetical protein